MKLKNLRGFFNNLVSLPHSNEKYNRQIECAPEPVLDQSDFKKFLNSQSQVSKSVQVHMSTTLWYLSFESERLNTWQLAASHLAPGDDSVSGPGPGGNVQAIMMTLG